MSKKHPPRLKKPWNAPLCLWRILSRAVNFSPIVGGCALIGQKMPKKTVDFCVKAVGFYAKVVGFSAKPFAFLSNRCA